MATPTPTPHPAPAAAAKPPAEKKEPKAPKAKKEGAVARPRLPKYPDEHLITVLKENAKARNANKRFQGYKTGMTVKAYVDAMKDQHGRTEGQTYADMRWDADHKFINIGPTVVPVPAPAAAPTAPAAA